jgi:hypothetical protein
LKFSGGTWTEYRRSSGSLQITTDTFTAATINAKLTNSNKYLGPLTYDLEGTKSEGEDIVGLPTEKYTADNSGNPYICWYNTQYRLCLKYTFGSNQVLVTAWDTTVKDFGGIVLP